MIIVCPECGAQDPDIEMVVNAIERRNYSMSLSANPDGTVSSYESGLVSAETVDVYDDAVYVCQECLTEIDLDELRAEEEDEEDF